MDIQKAAHIWGYRLRVCHEMPSQASLSGAPDSEKLDKPVPPQRRDDSHLSRPQVLQGLQMPGCGRPLPGVQCPYAGAPHSEAQSAAEPGRGSSVRLVLTGQPGTYPRDHGSGSPGDPLLARNLERCERSETEGPRTCSHESAQKESGSQSRPSSVWLMALLTQGCVFKKAVRWERSPCRKMGAEKDLEILVCGGLR